MIVFESRTDLIEFINWLDGSGIVVTDNELLEKTLEECIFNSEYGE